MTTGRVFLDTNVLVYQHHTGDVPSKTACALDVVGRLSRGRLTAVSPQVITEFLNVARRKLADEIDVSSALLIAEILADEHFLVPLDALTTREAIRVSRRYGLDFLDAQIWAAASVSGCWAILTEDTHGDSLEGISYVDPFAPGFDIEALLQRE